MMGRSALHCREDSRRRELVRSAPPLNGFDFLEVSDDQTVLTVFFLGNAPQWEITPRHLRIEGGRRVRDVRVVDVTVERSGREGIDDCMHVKVNRPGDYSLYTLCIVGVDGETGRRTNSPPLDFDIRYACVCFSFKAGCPSDLDCAPEEVCDEKTLPEPRIDYLAKDYSSFRRLILDRLALILPDWKERHIPDLGVALVELLAYAGDYLSYHQDAVATEAYLDTARRRISVRRHARLVDYSLHEGCNARAWVAVTVSQEHLELRGPDLFFTTAPEGSTAPMIRATDLRLEGPAPLAFEPLQPPRETAIDWYEAHNKIHFYTWGEFECCIPEGATSATLVDPGRYPDEPPDSADDCPEPAAARTSPFAERPADEHYRLRLRPCDVLIFEELKGPRTGNDADADLKRRHAVRLTRVTRIHDPLTRQLLVDVEWCDEDALPFPLCISTVTLPPECAPLEQVSVARGNVLLVDHGKTIVEELGGVPERETVARCEDECTPAEIEKQPGPYRPLLSRPGITFSVPLIPCRPGSCGHAGCGAAAASSQLDQDPRAAVACVELESFPAAPNGEPAFRSRDFVDPAELARAIASSEDALTAAGWIRAQLAPDLLARVVLWAANTDPLGPLPGGVRADLTHFLRSLVRTWQPRADLLDSGPDDAHFVVEIDDDRRAHLRFGDGDCGRRPNAGETFVARYRLGNGPAGNIGADVLECVAFRNAYPSGITLTSRNPLPARGGMRAEPIAEAKLRAPQLFRHRLQRAVTAADYAAIVMRDFKSAVQRAAAKLRWNGVEREVVVAIDAFGGSEPDSELLARIDRHLRRFRRIGHDLDVVSARQVPLDLGLEICVKPGYLRGHVKAALLESLGNRKRMDGRLGLFHPDNVAVGESVYLSRIVAEAQRIDGVESVVVSRLERLYEGPNGEIDAGLLTLGSMEVARLDNDPGFPENGRLSLTMRGGR